MKLSALEEEEEEDPMVEAQEVHSAPMGRGRREMVNTREEASALEVHPCLPGSHLHREEDLVLPLTTTLLRHLLHLPGIHLHQPLLVLGIRRHHLLLVLGIHLHHLLLVLGIHHLHLLLVLGIHLRHLLLVLGIHHHQEEEDLVRLIVTMLHLLPLPVTRHHRHLHLLATPPPQVSGNSQFLLF